MILSSSFLSAPRILLLLIATCSGLFAAEPPVRTFRIFTVVTAINGLKYDASARKTFDLAIGQLPQTTYPIPADNHLVIYKEVPPPLDSPVGTLPIKVIQAEAKIPSNAPRVLIAMIPLSSGKLTAMVITDDPSLHPAYQLRFLNLSRFQAALDLDSTLLTLDSGKFSMADWKKKGGILVQVAANKDNQWRLIMRQERRASSWARSYCFVFDYVPDPNQILPEPSNPPPATVRFFSENIPPPISTP